ncbi:MAG: hypothetical protein HOV97_05565 [Nonomuraea sp.]|nr:hypothetical protein [Nonomuraea sp.]
MTEYRRVRDANPDTTATQLVVEVNYEIRVEQYVDLVAYYSRFTDQGKERFFRWAQEQDDQWYTDEELVVNYLLPDTDDAGDVGAVPMNEGVADPEWVDINEADVRVRLRQGYRERSFDRAAGEFSSEDLDYLLAHVPWLRAFFDARAREKAESEPDPAEMARIPGPHDKPLEGL